VTKDLMYAEEIRQLVAGTYAALDPPGGPATRFYSAAQLDMLPDGVRQWALGVGNPIIHADLQEGDVVVDLGCGAGIDALLAARAVGPDGTVVGIELLPDMVARAAAFARQAGVSNVCFPQAEMECLPLPDGSVDVVVSNGAINLCARKSRVLAEARRVLRPGGRLCVTDLTIREEELPSEVLTHPSAWAG
jgi:arsenite methyltransferase